MERFGFIGVGAMGGALLKGLIEGGMEPGRIVAADAYKNTLDNITAKFGIEGLDVCGVTQKARVLFVAVKPPDMADLLREIAPVLRRGQTVVSVAAGVSIADLEKGINKEVGVIRVMPNTPCLVGEGAMAVSRGQYVTDEDLQMVLGWLEKIGQVHVVPEKLMDAVTGLSGSGPAYVCLMIEAMADGGVLAGLPRNIAMDLAVQTVLGAARMVRETKEHPAILRERVTSPGGTTAAGLYVLEKGCLRGTVAEAVQAAARRAKELAE